MLLAIIMLPLRSQVADIDSPLVRIDEWYRRRLRMVIWKQWKRIRTKLANLKRLGVKPSKAWEWANTRKSYWHTAKSFILSTTITTERLRETGYIFLTDYYRKVRIVNLGDRRVRNGTHGGVRGQVAK